MPFTFTDATARVQAGVCDGGDGLLYTMISRLVSHTTVPGIKACAREIGMIHVEGCITSTT